MKRIGLFLIAFLIIAGTLNARSLRKTRRLWNAEVPVRALDIESDGDVSINNNLLITGDLSAVTGVLNIKDVFLDVATADTDTICSQSISTATLLSLATTWTTSDFLTDSFITPRNMVARVYWQIGITTKTFVGSVVVTGINANGASITETLTLSTDTVTGSVAFASLTSLVISATTITCLPDSTVTFNIGTGDKIGLSNNVDAAGDVYNVNEAGSKTTNYTLSTTYNTIDFSSDGNGSNDYLVTYKARSRK